LNVFISWSGEKSRDVATALGEWLPQVLHAIDPFVSTRDLAAGSRWAIELAEKLEETDFGIVCVTRANQFEPWLNYEAGAIAKSIEASRIIPLAIDLAPAEIVHPLGQFQATKADETGIGEMVNSMNEACPSSISEKYLANAVEMWWPRLQSRFDEVQQRSYKTESKTTHPPREEREMLEEVLTTVRGMAREAPATDAPSRTPHQKLVDDVRDIMHSSGVRGWGVSYSSDAVKVRPREPLNQQTMEKFALLEQLRGVAISIQISEPELPLQST